MPTPPPANSAAQSDAAPVRDEAKARDDWFSNTPDPWQEIVTLEFGGDRTHATAVSGMVLNAEPEQRPVLEKQLLAALGKRELTEAGRLFVCRMLGLIGSAACVPAVAALLHEERTADVARIALDPMPDAAVDEAYRGALGKLTGAALIGLIGSVAKRGEAAASVELRKIAGSESQSREVREAAARAVQFIESRGA